ncbi:MAG TPA: TonB-dependent receptor, partial [Wenzhouxiangella sp.]
MSDHNPSWGMAIPLACSLTISMMFPIHGLADTMTNADLRALGVDPEENMIVTAKRRAESIETTLARASVITRQDIEQSQASDLKALLQTQAGIDLARTGGPGGQTSLFMRGTNSNHVLVLIDGIRVSASGTGGFQWELVDLATIDRIEIVRGPRAARWGSDAIGGVIQIFTRQAQGMSFRGAVGSYGERSGAFAAGVGRQSLTLSARQMDGFSAQNERGFAFDPDDDGFENKQLAGQGQLSVGQNDLRWSGRWLSGEIEFDDGVSDVEQYAAHLNYQMTLDDWSVALDGGFYRDQLESRTPFGVSENNTRRTQLSVIAQTPLNASLEWMIGIDGWRESGVNVGTWRENRTQWGIWTGLDGEKNAWSYSASVRLDDDERFGTESTGQLAMGWQFNPAVRFFASIGQGFRSPNFSQLFSPGFGGLFAGNPDLKPETSTSVEWGMDWAWQRNQTLGISAFYTDIDDLIDFSGVDFQAINIKQAQIKGLEISHQMSSDRWQSALNWTWQEPEDKDQQLPLLRRPKNKGSAVLTYALDQYQVGAEVIYVG